MIVGRDTERLDRHGMARAAIESVAENLTDGVFSTLFWATAGCLAGGPFGAAFAALTHRVFNILDAMWGKKNDRYRRFGTFAARTDDALNFIPARLILPCISLAALFVKGTSARRRSLRLGLPPRPCQPKLRLERGGLRGRAGPPHRRSGLLQGDSCGLSVDRNRAHGSHRQ